MIFPLLDWTEKRRQECMLTRKQPMHWPSGCKTFTSVSAISSVARSPDWCNRRLHHHHQGRGISALRPPTRRRLDDSALGRRQLELRGEHREIRPAFRWCLEQMCVVEKVGHHATHVWLQAARMTRVVGGGGGRLRPKVVGQDVVTNSRGQDRYGPLKYYRLGRIL